MFRVSLGNPMFRIRIFTIRCSLSNVGGVIVESIVLYIKYAQQVCSEIQTQISQNCAAHVTVGGALCAFCVESEGFSEFTNQTTQTGHQTRTFLSNIFLFLYFYRIFKVSLTDTG